MKPKCIWTNVKRGNTRHVCCLETGNSKSNPNGWQWPPTHSATTKESVLHTVIVLVESHLDQGKIGADVIEEWGPHGQRDRAVNFRRQANVGTKRIRAKTSRPQGCSTLPSRPKRTRVGRQGHDHYCPPQRPKIRNLTWDRAMLGLRERTRPTLHSRHPCLSTVIDAETSVEDSIVSANTRVTQATQRGISCRASNTIRALPDIAFHDVQIFASHRMGSTRSRICDF